MAKLNGFVSRQGITQLKVKVCFYVLGLGLGLV